MMAKWHHSGLDGVWSVTERQDVESVSEEAGPALRPWMCSAGQGHSFSETPHGDVGHQALDMDDDAELQEATADPMVVSDGQRQNALPGQSGFMSLMLV